MSRRVGAVIGAGFVALTLFGCSSDSKPAVTQSAFSTQAAPSSATAPPTTAPTTTPTTVMPPAPASSPSRAASTFVGAWRAGDRDTALTVAVPAAVDAVFAAGEPGALENRGCNEPPPGSPVLCVYRSAVGEVQVRVQPVGDGWYVDQARVTPA